ncbi:hypothetical protein Tco_0856891 [Tanacetum coccineum]|uniref:Uncharacterized protein n=1 Tax=Tanacetum coccineum TaxID=301880 RepID=A0ABQ5BAA0_9ASTR
MSSNTSSKKGFMSLELKLTSNSKRGLEKVTESSCGTLMEEKSSHEGKTFLLSLLEFILGFLMGLDKFLSTKNKVVYELALAVDSRIFFTPAFTFSSMSSTDWRQAN